MEVVYDGQENEPDEALPSAAPLPDAGGEWYLVLDGQPYGPVSLEELRDWFLEGRLDDQTYVCRSGEPEWRRFIEVPELADLAMARSTTDFGIAILCMTASRGVIDAR